MSSSEEYLDSLLKSLTEGDSHTSTDSSGAQEFDTPDDMQENTENVGSESGEHDMAMSMNELEAMFASMGEITGEEMGADEAPSNDSELPEDLLAGEVTLEDEEIPEELSEEPMDDFALDESLMSEEMALEDEEIPEELSEESIDDFVLDESLMPEELELEEEEIPEELPEEPIDDFVLDESLMPEELELEEEEIPEELPEEPIDDFVLDESLMPEELELEGEEPAEELPEESESDDLALSDLGLDDLGLDDLGLEDAGQDDEDALAGGESLDDFALAESGEDDEELSALLAGMESDEDLAEINDLLEKADQGMSGDEDMLALLGDVSGADDTEESFSLFGGEEAVEGETENIREITPKELEERENSKQDKKEKKKAEKERKKKEKLAKKNKKKKGAQEEGGEGTSGDEDDELNSLLESMDVPEEKPKKQGFFAKIVEALLEEDEDEEAAAGEGEAGSELGGLSDENRELLAELRAEDKKNAKKKEKKEKKEKKDKKGAATEAKNKKPKKEKKKKEKKAEDEVKVPEKRLSKKKVITIFLFCGTVAACIIILSSLLPDQIEKQEARVAYDYGQYEQVYELLYGKKLSEEEDILFQKSNIILQAKRKLESYENYRKLDMPLEAINALIEGVGLYQNLRDEAELYNISNELYDVYEQILAALADSYGVSESEALEILSAGDDVTYSQRLEAIIYGDIFGSDEENLPEVKQDILPEEEEIIDRLQDTESAEVNDEASQTEEDDTESQSQLEEIDEVMQAEEETLGE